MRIRRLLPTTAAALLACSSAVAGAERYEDELGDAVGDAPDIVAITVDEPEGPLLHFSFEFASEPPISSDQTGTDVLWLAMDTDPEVAFPELDGYGIGTMGATLPEELGSGGYLLAGEDLYWRVVDVGIDGSTVTFGLDRKLLGDPTKLQFRVYSAALSGSLATEETDHYPEEGEPPAVYTLRREWDQGARPSQPDG